MTRGRLQLAARVLGLLLAAAGFSLVVLSAVRLLALPPPAMPMADLGWPEGVDAPSFALVDADGERAWLGLGASVCRLVIARGAIERCEVLPWDTQGRVQHARGGGATLFVFGESGTLATALLRDAGGPPILGAFTDGSSEPALSAVTNVIWDPAASRFAIFLDARHGRRRVRVIPVGSDGVVLPEEPVGGDLASLPPAASASTVLAGLASSPPALLLSPLPRADAALLRRGALTPFDFDRARCGPLGMVGGECALVASRATFRNHAPFAVFVDDVGELTPAPAWGDDTRFDLAERAREPGGSVPALVRRSLVEGEDVLDVPLDGEALQISTREASGEELLVVRSSDLPWRPLARKAGTIAGAWVVPGKGAAFVALSSGRGAVVRPGASAPKASWPEVRAMIEERLHGELAEVVGFFAALGLFPLLVVAGLVGLLRRRAGLVVTLSLAAYAAGVAVLLSVSTDLFP